MTTYATDEEIALRAPADFLALCPKDQTLAFGTDGILLLTDPWTLRSPTINFAAMGLMPGQVVRLSEPSTFGPDGEFFAVDVVGPGGLTLRRKGQASGVGRPPSPTLGLSGVEFVVRTLSPQLDRASYDLNLRFGIDETIAGRRSCDIQDPRVLIDATVLTVLSRQYLDRSRRFSGPSDEPGDWYGVKARLAKAELDDLLDRLVIRWHSATNLAETAPTTRFSTRLSR